MRLSTFSFFALAAAAPVEFAMGSSNRVHDIYVGEDAQGSPTFWPTTIDAEVGDMVHFHGSVSPETLFEPQADMTS